MIKIVDFTTVYNLWILLTKDKMDRWESMGSKGKLNIGVPVVSIDV